VSITDKLKNIFGGKEMPLDVVAEELRKRLISELGFRIDPNDNGNLIKDINDNYGMSFYHDTEYPIGFGFYHYEGYFSTQQKHRHNLIFERWEFTEGFDDFYDWGDQWMSKHFSGNNQQGWGNAEMVNFLIVRVHD
jgi:hypothetical protein